MTTGWKQGQALVINHLPGRDVITTITSPTIDRFPRPLRRGDPVRVAVADAVERATWDVKSNRWGLTTTKGEIGISIDREPFVDQGES